MELVLYGSPELLSKVPRGKRVDLDKVHGVQERQHVLEGLGGKVLEVPDRHRRCASPGSRAQWFLQN